MKISIIIPVKPGGAVRALGPLEQLAAGSPDHEIIVAEGTRPSRQRNMAAAAASGDIIYFLDDDSLVVPDVLLRLATTFADRHVAAVGGPSVTPQSDSSFQRAAGWTLASAFGGGAVRNRYRRSGTVRKTDDRELILCNLAFRKDLYLQAGGLNEKLYPNEENELIDRLLADGFQLLHDPDMFVTRSQRPTLKAYIRQMLTYGRGRAEQTLLTRSIGFKALVPAIFVLYIVFLPFVADSRYLIPLLLYVLAVAVNMLSAALSAGLPVAARLPVTCFLLHFCYGLGFLTGLCRPRYRQSNTDESPVSLRIHRPFAAAQ